MLLNKPQVYALLNKSDLAAGSAWKKGHLCLLRKALSRLKVLDLHCELSEESAPRLVHRTLELRERWKMARDGTMGANMGPRLFFAVGICIRFQGSKGVCPGTSAEDGPAFSALYIYTALEEALTCQGAHCPGATFPLLWLLPSLLF